MICLLFKSLPFAALCMTLVVLTSGGCGQRSVPQSTAPAPRHYDLLDGNDGELVEEYWDAHFMRGAKMGHRQTRIYRLEPTTPALLKIVSVDRLEVRRFGDVTTNELTTVSLESEDGKIQRVAYRVKNGDSVRQAEGVVEGSELELRRDAGQSVLRFKWNDQQGGYFAIDGTLRRDPLKLGERRTVDAFLPLLDRLVRIELVAVRREQVELSGETRELLRIEAKDLLAEGWSPPTIHWVDEDGQIQKTQEAFLDREMERVDAQVASRPNDFLQLDLGIGTGVPVRGVQSNLSLANQAVYQVQLSELAASDVFAHGLSQRIIDQGNGRALISVSRVTPSRPSTPDVEVDAPTDDDRQPNSLIQSDHPRVMSVANAVAGSIDDPWQAARMLESHLFRRLAKADYSQVFGSAAEVLEHETGDCSEHAVLLAATCRARGIPSRVAVGLIYSPPDKSFLYHMWTEVWIRDRWVPLDATIGDGGIGAAHIKLRHSSLARETAYSMVSPVIYVIGKLEIEVVSTGRDSN